MTVIISQQMRDNAKEWNAKHPKTDSLAAYRARVAKAEAKRRKDAGMR